MKEQTKKLPAELKECLPPLLACLNDRNPDVRKAAQESILPFMIQTGFDSMLKAASKIDVCIAVHYLACVTGKSLAFQDFHHEFRLVVTSSLVRIDFK